MSFQFQCPKGHPIAADLSQIGQQCRCPTCGIVFFVSEPLPPPAVATSLPVVPPPPPPGVREKRFEPSAPLPVSPNQPAPAPAFVPKAQEPELLHIPCPSGHVLETPVEMLDQEAICPQCGVRFRLRRTQSIEFRRRQELEERVRLERVGNLWLNWAVVAVVLVAIGFVAMIVLTRLSQPIE